MTTHTRAHFFGATYFGSVHGTRFNCAITTAPEGMFKSYSICVSTFDHKVDWDTAFRSGQYLPVAKAILNPMLARAGRRCLHEGLVNHFDTPDRQALGLALAIFSTFEAMKKEGVVTDYLIHPELQKIVDENPDCKAVA